MLISGIPPKRSQGPKAGNSTRGLPTLGLMPYPGIMGARCDTAHEARTHSYGGPLFVGPACCFNFPTTPEEAGAIFSKLETASKSLPLTDGAWY